MSTAVLEVDNLSRAFGGVQAVNGVTFALTPGEIVGLIGPNGAGKTTLVNLVTGVVSPSSGTVRFGGRDVTRQRPWQAARNGLARTFQVVQPFPEMTVLDNVAAGALFAGRAASRADAEAQARDHLSFVGLAYEAHRPASALPLPGRKRLELAKSLAMKPTWLSKFNTFVEFGVLALVFASAAGWVDIDRWLPLSFRIVLVTVIASAAHYAWLWKSGRLAMHRS